MISKKFELQISWFTELPTAHTKFTVLSKQQKELTDLEYNYCVYKVKGKPHLTINFKEYQEGYILWKN